MANKSVNSDRLFRCATKPAGYAWRHPMKNLLAPILVLLFNGGVNAQECPLLVEPDIITAGTPVTANWTSVTVCHSEPVIEVSGSLVTVDFKFGFCGVVPPGSCGENRALIGKLAPGLYTLIAIGHGTQRSVDFEVLPATIPSLGTIGKSVAVVLFLCLAIFRLTTHSSPSQQAGAGQFWR